MIDFQGLISLLNHRKTLFLLTTGGVLLLSCLAIMSLPSVYTSSARILVEREGFFGTEGSTQGSDNINQRLHAVRTRVLSSSSVEELLRRHELLDAGATIEDFEAAVDAFKKEALIEFDNVAVVNPYTGKAGMYSQGLIIEYRHTDPQIAHAVVSDLTDRILNRHLGQDSDAVAHRRQYLETTFAETQAKLSEVRSQLADYKQGNALFLPEVHAIAMRRYEENQNQVARLQDNVRRLRRSLDDIAGELATSRPDAFVLTADGKRILGVDEQIRLLEAEYAKKASRYSERHPELKAIETELESLRAHKIVGGTGGLQAEIQSVSRELVLLKDRYSKDHPEVLAKTAELEGLEKRLAERGEVADGASTVNATNPEYNRLLIRKQSLQDEYDRENRRLRSEREGLKEIEDQLAKMPQVEQELASLLQEVQLAEAAHSEIENELELLTRQSGMRDANLLDHLVLVEAAKVPQNPSGPKRLFMLPIAGLFAAFFGALVTFLFHIYRDHILDASDVLEIIDAPVYAIPRFK